VEKMFLAEVMADEDIQGIQYDEARDTCLCPEGKELQNDGRCSSVRGSRSAQI